MCVEYITKNQCAVCRVNLRLTESRRQCAKSWRDACEGVKQLIKYSSSTTCRKCRDIVMQKSTSATNGPDDNKKKVANGKRLVENGLGEGYELVEHEDDDFVVV